MYCDAMHCRTQRLLDITLKLLVQLTLSGPVRLFAPAEHDVMAFRRAVMQSTEQFVERDRAIASVVTFKIAVMQVMVIALTNRMSVGALAFPLVVSNMAHRRR